MAQEVKLSSPDKVLWPQPGFTKADLRAYYEAAADRLLPQLRDRPLTIKRFPDGIGTDQDPGEGFFQKQLPKYAPQWLGRHQVWTPTSKRTVDYAVVNTTDDLRWLANQSALELHPWTARTDKPDRPDQLIFDLDPASSDQDVAQAAWWLRELLDEVALPAAIKTSGKRGLHLYIPIQRRYDFGQLRAFALSISRWCADRHPGELTVEMRIEDRGGRLLLDWSRAGNAQTSAAPYSPRGVASGAVSMPLEWDQVNAELDPNDFTLATALARPDAWANMPGPVRLETAFAAAEAAGYPLVDRSPRARTTT